MCALVLYCRRTQFSGAPLIVQVFLASRVSMGPWRAAARGVAVEVLRFLVSGLGDKERCPVSFDWRAEDQVAYWREEAEFCRDRLRESHSCAAELEFLRSLQTRCWETSAVYILVFLGFLLGAICAGLLLWLQNRA